MSSGAEDLLMFASDNPHHEGTDDPIGRYQKTMAGLGKSVKKKFFEDNFRRFMGGALALS